MQSIIDSVADKMAALTTDVILVYGATCPSKSTTYMTRPERFRSVRKRAAQYKDNTARMNVEKMRAGRREFHQNPLKMTPQRELNV